MIKYIKIEWIKLFKNSAFWIVLSIFVLFSVFSLKQYIIDQRIKELGPLLTASLAALTLPIIFLNGFIPTLIGQEFRFNAIKFELLAGYSRLQKFLANLSLIFLCSILFSILFYLLAITFLLVDQQLPHFDILSLKRGLLIFIIFLYYSYFLNTLILLIRNTGLTMFIAFVYFFISSYFSYTGQYTLINSLFPVSTLYNLIAPLLETDPTKLPTNIFNPYAVMSISSMLFLAINFWIFKYRDIH